MPPRPKKSKLASTIAQFSPSVFFVPKDASAENENEDNQVQGGDEDEEHEDEDEDEVEFVGLEALDDDENQPERSASPPPTVPQKRRLNISGKGAKSKKASSNPSKVSHKTVTYVLTFSGNTKKATRSGKKKSLKSATIRLSTDEAWSTLQDAIVAKIAASLNAECRPIESYSITAVLSRVIPRPGIPLNSEDDYEVLKQHIVQMKTSSGPLVSLDVTNVKTAEEEEKEEELSENKGKKSQKSDPSLLPGNIAKTQRVLALREKYKCNGKTDKCAGTICYTGPEYDGHLPMSHAMIDCWASWSLKEDPDGLLVTPPNHHLFPRTGAQSTSPVLQRRLQTQAQNAQPSSSLVQIGTELVGILKASLAPTASAPATVTPAVVDTVSLDNVPLVAPNHTAPVSTCALDDKSAKLIPVGRQPGADMPIEEFCAKYDLDEAIHEKLRKNGFKYAKHMRHLSQGNLLDMAFLLGEVAAVRDAVEEWSVYVAS